MSSNLDTLFIRACKSKDPEKRISSLYRRFFYNGEQSKISYHAALVSILGDVCQRCGITTTTQDAFQYLLKERSLGQYMTRMLNNDKWVERDMTEYMVRYYIDKVRYKSKDEFPANFKWGNA